jgi:peptidoglycan/xylan/chitin deacetylase (PgdA/CDA1 family)
MTRSTSEIVVGVAHQLVKSLAVAYDRVARPVTGVVVLIYHRVGGGSGLAVDLPVALFDAQMAALSDAGRIVSLEDALALLAGGRPEASAAGDATPVVVTFDDGTADFAQHALPVLTRHRVPATLYVATDFIDSARSFPDDGKPLSWAAVADCVATGLVDIGSHTHTHALLDRLAPANVAGELDRSIELVAANVGQAPRDFAYPKALSPSSAADRAVRARFRSAAIAGTHANPVGTTDVYRLARSPIQVRDGMRWFTHKSDGGMVLEDRLRALVNRRRYAGAAT